MINGLWQILDSMTGINWSAILITGSCKRDLLKSGFSCCMDQMLTESDVGIHTRMCGVFFKPLVGDDLCSPASNENALRVA